MHLFRKFPRYWTGFLLFNRILDTAATAAAWRNYPPPGQLIDVGGYRLHLNARGEDQELPAVILEHGATAMSAQWGWVMPELAERTRVVAYDRPGMGWSDASPQLLEAPGAVEDLYAALQQAGVHGPYLSHHHLKNLESEAYLGDSAAAFLAERETLEAIPLVVLSAAEPDGAFNAQQRAALTALHARLADRSSEGVHQIVDGAGHVSIVTHQEHAQAVTDAILTMLETVR